MKKTLTGSTLSKIIAFFLLAVSYLAGCAGAWITFLMVDADVYTYGGTEDSLVKEFLGNQVSQDGFRIMFGRDNDCVLNDLSWISNYCMGSNLEVNLISCDEEDELALSYCTFTGREAEVGNTYISYTLDFSVFLEKNAEDDTGTWYMGSYSAAEQKRREETESVFIEQYTFFMTIFVNPEFPVHDRYRELAQTARALYKARNIAPALALGGIFAFLVCFIFLMCAAGHRNEGKMAKEGITPSLLHAVPLDLLTFVYVFLASVGIAMGAEFASGILSLIIVFLVFGMAEVIVGTIFCMECAIRLKLGGFWKNTIIYAIFRLCKKVFRILYKSTAAMVKGIPFVADILLVFLCICVFEFFGLMFWGSGELAVAWVFEKLVMLPAVVYFALMWRRLKKGSEALAAGDLQYKIDTSNMLFDFKEQGENLNQIAKGINTAVEQRMKSEHLKTELITNVSHDLKTPLTSIINYADLIASTTDDSEKIAEYSEVLLRQSKRLKKLLDDLMEASKATTGNLEVMLQPCEIDVLLTQAVGEYEQRFEEKKLQLITRQPEGQIRVMADGRHLWRVFDNLLNNICKYALENSRVYLSVEVKDNKVNIVFRNISKYILDISGEELEERFVRGDKSRHMEGNGLGLSIAKSLMSLQGGEMEIVTDGDLFKVILTFTML